MENVWNQTPVTAHQAIAKKLQMKYVDNLSLLGMFGHAPAHYCGVWSWICFTIVQEFVREDR